MNVTCPHCQVELRVRDSLAGRRIQCPHCTEAFETEEREAPAELLDFEEIADDSAAANRIACPMCGAENSPSATECPACGEPLTANSSPSERVWRDGRQLVMRQGSSLPYRCIKTNEPADDLLHRKLYWHHPALYVVVLFSPLIYVILAFVLRKKAEVEIPVCQRIRQRRGLAIILAWVFGLGSIGLLIGGLILSDPQFVGDAGVVIAFGGLAAGLIGVVVALQFAGLLAASKITDKYVWIKGAHAEYLDQLPDWPGERDGRGKLRS